MASCSSSYETNSEKFIYLLCIIWPSLMILMIFDDDDVNMMWVIPKIMSANLCKPIHDISYSTSICPFESEKCGKEGKKIQKFEYLENEKSFLELFFSL